MVHYPNDFLNSKKAAITGLLDSQPPKRRFLVNDFLGRDPLVTVAAPGGMGKGFFGLQIALSLATKVPLFHNPAFTIPGTGKTVFLSLEDDRTVFHERLCACFDDLTGEMSKEERAEFKRKVESRLLIPPSAGRFFPLYPDEMGRNKVALINFANQYEHVKLIILDPANLLLHEDMSKNDMVSGFSRVLREINLETGATVMLLAHTNKSSMRDNQSGGDATSVLGAVSLVNASRFVFTLSAPGEKFLSTHGLNGDPQNFVNVRNAKANYVHRGMGNVLLRRCAGGLLRFVPIAPPNPMKFAEELREVVRKNPDIGKTELLKLFSRTAGVSRKEAEDALETATGKGLVRGSREGENNKISYNAEKREEEKNLSISGS